MTVHRTPSSPDGWSVEEAMGMAVAWGISRDVDSLEAHVDGDTLIINATKTFLAPVENFVITLKASGDVEVEPCR